MRRSTVAAAGRTFVVRAVIVAAGAAFCAAGFTSAGAAPREGASRTGKTKFYNCALSTTCLESENTASAGTAIEGTTLSGIGVIGAVSSPAYTNYVEAGVFGVDTTGLTGSRGVYGYSSQGAGLYGESESGVGIYGTAFGGGGYSSLATAIFGDDESGSQYGLGVEGYSLNGVGMEAYSSKGFGLLVYGHLDGLISTIASSTVGYSFIGTGPYSGEYVETDGGGNLLATGKIQQGGQCKNGCSFANGEDRRVMSYTPQTSLPSMEDTGEARLVNGNAYVRIDAALSNVIDDGVEYSVFVTPEGNSRGLYVTQKSAAGFAVHENEGGRSSLPFAYRIVAKPYGSATERLPRRTFKLPPRVRAQEPHR